MNVSDEPAASIYGADNLIATHPIFVEGNLLFALICVYPYVQGGSNMTGTDLCVNKLHCAAAVRP